MFVVTGCDCDSESVCALVPPPTARGGVSSDCSPGQWAHSSVMAPWGGVPRGLKDALCFEGQSQPLSLPTQGDSVLYLRHLGGLSGHLVSGLLAFSRGLPGCRERSLPGVAFLFTLSLCPLQEEGALDPTLVDTTMVMGLSLLSCAGRRRLCSANIRLLGSSSALGVLPAP